MYSLLFCVQIYNYNGINLHIRKSGFYLLLTFAHQIFSSAHPARMSSVNHLHSSLPQLLFLWAIYTHFTQHFCSCMFITAVQVHSSGLRCVAASPLSVAAHWSTLNTLFHQSNPLNPLECFVLLVMSVESENTVAKAVVPNIPVWGRHGWFIII